MELIRSGVIGRDYCPYDRLIPIWSGENQFLAIDISLYY